MDDKTPTYALGQEETEQEKLIQQSLFYEALTKEVLVRAGIVTGMRVLDVGCGVGDVSLLMASLVGPTGSVVGVDSSKESLDRVRSRASQANLKNVEFMESDIIGLVLDSLVDAIVGRFVLMFLSDPATTLRQLCEHLRPGGLGVFQEMDISGARMTPPLALCEQVLDWIRGTFQGGGVELDMGSRLFPTISQAGLPESELLLRARVEGSDDSSVYDYMAQTLRSLLPQPEKLGVTTAEEVQIDSLADRLRKEVREARGVIVLPSLIGAWSRTQQAASLRIVL